MKNKYRIVFNERGTYDIQYKNWYSLVWQNPYEYHYTFVDFETAKKALNGFKYMKEPVYEE